MSELEPISFDYEVWRRRTAYGAKIVFADTPWLEVRKEIEHDLLAALRGHPNNALDNITLEIEKEVLVSDPHLPLDTFVREVWAVGVPLPSPENPNCLVRYLARTRPCIDGVVYDIPFNQDCFRIPKATH